MAKEKDALLAIVRRIEEESEYGDISMACRMSKVTTPVARTALAKKLLLDLTVGELRVIDALIQILDERKDLRKKLHDQYAE